MATGKIGVTTENIFPIIKKFLYSDHEIFLRELVSNAIDATQKIKTLSTFGDFKGDLGELNVTVSVDKKNGTLTVSDHGIGMDAEDIDKYINQIAFSGAEEFLAKYKDSANNIIGHFGLGFYSAFMVSDKVVIRSLSYKNGAKAVEWKCDGSPEYSLSEIEKKDRGTDIILYIDKENNQFLEQSTIDTLLKKYCRFLPVPVISGKEQEWKDGKMVDTDKDKVINATEPLWAKKPSELTDKDYIDFYRELMPGMEDPMFWIHLNVDYPFTLTGILYFPKIKNNIDLQRNRIQLYCNQVYVTDQVEGVVPEFMMLMQGVIDSPDIPLNVSRSYLQSDRQVKQISSYITKKVAEKLEKMFKDDRKIFENKWDDISIFIIYGMLTDEKFFSNAKNFFLFKDTDGKHYTLDEYKTLVESAQTDKNGKIIYLYATDATEQYAFIDSAKEKGYSVLLLNGQLDNHLIGLLEQKLENIQFSRVDTDTPDRLILKKDSEDAELTPLQNDIASLVFSSQIPDIEKASFTVAFNALRDKDMPATIIQNEYMRRMKEMAAMQPGVNFYATLPDSYTLVVNTKHPAVKQIIEFATSSLENEVTPIRSEIEALESEIKELDKDTSKKDENKDVRTQKQSKLDDDIKRKESVVSAYASAQPNIRQIIDIALLQSNLLKGEELRKFLQRSADLLK